MAETQGLAEAISGVEACYGEQTAVARTKMQTPLLNLWDAVRQVTAELLTSVEDMLRISAEAERNFISTASLRELLAPFKELCSLESELNEDLSLIG